VFWVEFHLSGDGPFIGRCHKWLEKWLGCAKALFSTMSHYIPHRQAENMGSQVETWALRMISASGCRLPMYYEMGYDDAKRVVEAVERFYLSNTIS